jgi:glucose/arabinose dehydrogenase
MRSHPAIALAVASALAACGDDSGASPDAYVPTCEVVEGRPALGLVQIASGLDMPVYVTSPPGDARLFVLEKTGAVRVIEEGTLLPDPFLDVSVPGISDLSDERGLLGLAFHPGYAENRKLYVFYTDANSDTVVEQYLASESNPNQADPASATQVFYLQDFAGNHNGGTIQFGPDGYLYIGIGDGGGANDPMDYGQNLDVAFGKILRIDVDELPYTIPADNPFAGATPGLDEIWAYGLRNPWRWSFDRMTGDLYIGDVGQGAWEEWDVEPASSPGGVNYGWNDREGAHCFDPDPGCATDGRVDPVYEVSQGEGACSAIGGYVYRGCQMPGYHGTYFFADYCGGWVRSFEWDGAGGYTDFTEWPSLGGGGDIVSFGEDADGELYLVRQDTGQIMRIVPQ